MKTTASGAVEKATNVASIETTPAHGLPTEAQERKAIPLCRGVLDFFPDALAEVARVSEVGRIQHKLDTLHFNRATSSDDADALLRHLVDRGKLDLDGCRHAGKAAWRALALLQREIEHDRHNGH